MKYLKRSSAILLLLPFLFTYIATVFAASEGPNSPDTGAEFDRATATSTWSAETNVTTSDNSYATCVAGAPAFIQCEFLRATDFDFAIPSGATIDGIVVEVEAKSSDGDGGLIVVGLVKADSAVGTTKGDCGTTVGTSDAYISYGTSSDLWGTTWTVAEINATGFGFQLSSTDCSGSGFSTLSIDHMRVTVHYTESAGGGSQTREVKVFSIY